MANIALRDLCGVRSGDKGDISDLSLFADDDAAYAAIVAEVTAARVKAHFGALVSDDVQRYEVPNVIARILDPLRAEWYRQQGMNTICPTRVAIDMLERAVREGAPREVA